MGLNGSPAGGGSWRRPPSLFTLRSRRRGLSTRERVHTRVNTRGLAHTSTPSVRGRGHWFSGHLTVHIHPETSLDPAPGNTGSHGKLVGHLPIPIHL